MNPALSFNPAYSFIQCSRVGAGQQCVDLERFLLNADRGPVLRWNYT
jgi:hypothetical protein